MAQKAVEYLEAVDVARPFYLQLNLDGPYALPPSNHGPARNRHYARHVGQRFESMPLEPTNDHLLSKLTGPYVPGEKLFELASLEAMWNHLLYRTIRMQGDPRSYANFLSQNEIVDDAPQRFLDLVRAFAVFVDVAADRVGDGSRRERRHSGRELRFEARDHLELRPGHRVDLVRSFEQGASERLGAMRRDVVEARRRRATNALRRKRVEERIPAWRTDLIARAYYASPSPAAAAPDDADAAPQDTETAGEPGE